MLRDTCFHGFCLLALACAVSLPTGAPAENPSLAERCPEETLKRILLPRSQWRPFPKADERAAWEQLPGDTRKTLVALGEECAAVEVPNLPATLYLEFRRVGNRSRYQDVWMARRKLLNSLALAECVEGEGRFLDPLANVAWAICEESSWTWPAHISRQKAGSGLPDTTEPVVALFSAQTGKRLWRVKLWNSLPEVRTRIGPFSRQDRRRTRSSWVLPASATVVGSLSERTRATCSRARGSSSSNTGPHFSSIRAQASSQACCCASKVTSGQ